MPLEPVTFTQQQIEKILRLKEECMPKIIECLSTMPYVEGLNEFYRIRIKMPRECSFTDLTEIGELLKAILVSTLEWLRDLIMKLDSSSEEREMRINQAVITCMTLLCYDKKLFRKAFKHYVAPFLIKPGSDKHQIAESIRDKLEEIIESEEAEEIHSIVFSDYEDEIERLEIAYLGREPIRVIAG